MFDTTSTDLIILKDDLDKFKSDITMVHNIALQFGGDISHLFAEVCAIYGLLEELEKDDLNKDSEKMQIYATIIDSLNVLSLALNESNKIKELLDDASKEQICLEAEDFQNISKALLNVGLHYLFMVQLITVKRYLSDEFILSIRERLNFLFCPEFEAIKKRFNSIKIESKNTLETTIH